MGEGATQADGALNQCRRDKRGTFTHIFFFLSRVPCMTGWLQTYHVSEDKLELLILLLLPLTRWDGRHAPRHLILHGDRDHVQGFVQSR